MWGFNRIYNTHLGETKRMIMSSSLSSAAARSFVDVFMASIIRMFHRSEGVDGNIKAKGATKQKGICDKAKGATYVLSFCLSVVPPSGNPLYMFTTMLIIMHAHSNAQR